MSTIVYVLTNPAMPGIVKIGKTNRDNPQVRMNELYTTGVPLPFECAIAINTEDEQAADLEKALHTAFGPYRLNPSREFFEIEPYQAEALLQAWPGEDVTPQVNAESDELDPSDRAAVNRFKRRRPNLNFIEMGIQVGAILISVETDEEAEVTGERQVTFRGEGMSLTAATRAALNLNSDQHSVPPTPHWTFEGRNLREIYNETYGHVPDGTS